LNDNSRDKQTHNYGILMMEKLWFYDYKNKYNGNEPPFFDSSTIPEAKSIEENYHPIHQELKELWEKNSNETENAYLKDLDIFDDKQFPAHSWKKIIFHFGGIKNKEAYKRFPITASLVDSPNIICCFVSKTLANSIIRPHCGEYNAYWRIHLGLSVPSSDKSICGIIVENQCGGWQNGKALAFLDAYEHHAYNRAQSDRYLLLIDVIRPEYSSRKNFIIVRAVVTKIYFFLCKKLKVRRPERIYSRVLDGMSYLLFFPLQFLIWLNNRVTFIKF